MHEKSVNLLNQGLADELTAIYQYMYFHFHCDDQGYDPLANLFKRTAIDEMLHTERLAERILFLKGEVEMAPNAQSLDGLASTVGGAHRNKGSRKLLGTPHGFF